MLGTVKPGLALERRFKMARPMRKGIDYYPLDVNFLSDLKVRKIIQACGPNSIAIIMLLLGTIYGDEGYFMRWDEDVCFLITEAFGVKQMYVEETLKKCLQVGFFEKNLFDRYHILTSRGVQKRFFEITKRRKNFHVDQRYLLVNVTETGVIATETPVNVTEMGVNVCNGTQSKVKESKDVDIDVVIYNKLNSLLKTKVTKETINKLKGFDLERLVEEVGRSTWLQEKANLNISNRQFFIEILRGSYRDFSGKGSKKNGFHNFSGSSADFTAEELEELAKKKRGM